MGLQSINAGTEVLRLSETLGQKTIDHAALDQICATFRGDKEWSTHSPMVMDDLVRVATSLGLGCVAGRVNPGSGLQTLRIQGPPPYVIAFICGVALANRG